MQPLSQQRTMRMSVEYGVEMTGEPEDLIRLIVETAEGEQRQRRRK